MKTFPILYKKSGSGAVQQWTVIADRIEEAGVEFGAITTEHGQVGGKLQMSSDIIREGKNPGKKNETTPTQQALNEAEAKWKKKIKNEGYVESLERAQAGETDVAGGIFPMLAKTLEDVPEKKRKWPYDYQRKFNGLRCLVEVDNGEVSLWSRKHQPILGVPHIQRAYEEAYKDFTGKIGLDGEIYRHGWSLQKISGYVRKAATKPGFEQLGHNVYDMPENDLSPGVRPWHVRKIELAAQFEFHIGLNNPHIHPVETISVESEEQARAQEKIWVKDGYEGGILRDPFGEYEAGKRSSNLLKVKSFKEMEFEIVSVFTGRGKFEGLAMFSCKTAEGKDFDCTAPGNFEDRAEFFKRKDELPGKMLTVKFFEWTEDMKPSHGVGVVVRDYE